MSNVAESLIGALVLVVAGVFLVYASQSAEIGSGGGYQVVAKFRKAEGISVGGDVRIAGVKIGTISSMELDPKTYYATLNFSIDGDVELPEDSSAKITSASLLGDSYIAIEPGGSDYMLADGDELSHTQSSISLGDLIGRFVQGTGVE
ncbi:MAG: outer membrane lipid asymmetry maintenance protein MlaD [Pseudomonadota bacterium]